MGGFEGFLYGFAGAFAALLVEVVDIQRQPRNRRPRLQERSFWVARMGLVVFGGILVTAYLGAHMPMNQVVAIHVGATAPFFLGGAVKATPPIRPSSSEMG